MSFVGEEILDDGQELRPAERETKFLAPFSPKRILRTLAELHTASYAPQVVLIAHAIVAALDEHTSSGVLADRERYGADVCVIVTDVMRMVVCQNRIAVRRAEKHG